MAVLLLLLMPTIQIGQGHQGLFPFGNSTDDQAVPNFDDGSSEPLIFSQPFIFFGRSYDQIIVNTNGLLSFNEGFTEYLPSEFPHLCRRRFPTDNVNDCIVHLPTLIAPFWRDFDPSMSGNIYYHQTADSDLIQSFHTMLLNNNISKNVNITHLIIATWDRVPPFGSSSNVFNTLQTILAGDGVSTSYVAFIYADIEWGGGAQIGFNAGDGITHFTVPGALSPATLNISQMSNVGSPGLFIYKVDGVECNETEFTGTDTLYRYSCTDDHFLIDICGYVKLRIEKKMVELSEVVERYNVSIRIAVTEKIGIMSFKDVNFVVSTEKPEMKSEVEVMDGHGLSLPKFISIPHNDTRTALTLRVTRMDELPTSLLLKFEATSKQICFENGTDIQIILFGATQSSFKLKMLYFSNCSSWTATKHTTEDIISARVVDEIENSCSCNFTPDHITNATFICNGLENTQTMIIMRAQISYTGPIKADRLVNIISLWVKNGPNVTINLTLLAIDRTCPVEVDLLSETPDNCFDEIMKQETESDTPVPTKLHIIEISSSLAAFLTFVGGVLIITCACCYQKRSIQRNAPKCASLPTITELKGNEYHINKEEKYIEEEYYETISDVRGVDDVQVTSNAAYGSSLQYQSVICPADYEECNLQNSNNVACKEGPVYDVPL